MLKKCFKSKESSYFKPICLKQEDHSPRCILQQFLLVILTSQILQCGWFLWLLTHHICSVAARVVRYSSVGLVCGVSWYFLNSYRGYYTVTRRYEFYFRVAKQYFTNERSEWVKYCFCHEKIKFISSSRRVMFLLLYRQNDIDETITKITSSLNSRVRLWKINHSGGIFPVKHSCLYNKLA